MNGTQFRQYIIDNFNLDGTAMRLIDNAIFYAESRYEEVKDQRICLSDLLDGIGLTDDEINQVSL